MNRTLRARAACVVLALVAACSSPSRVSAPPEPVGPDPNVLPELQREFRGLWVATVSNIDWPSRAGQPASEQQAELLSIMDRAVTAGLNAIVLHVRPAGDALYESSLEPWGRMLSGTQGVSPGYDPLAFAVEQAHARGLELHAWVNPYRAGNTADSANLAATHLFKRRRDLVLVYGTQLWMDPGEPEVANHTLAVVEDIVRRYDVDAVHLDDYFYPYPQNVPNGGGPLAFPDTSSYRRFGGTMPLADWRRANVDMMVSRLNAKVHETKPWVRVGISPFGIWRPGNPPGITGLDAYAAIYADARKWLRNGWLDYLAPQLYWRIDPPQQSYTALLDWWRGENVQDRHVWPGIATYRRYEGTPLYTLDEIVNQVTAARTRRTGGMLFYNTSTTLTRNGGEVARALAENVFAERAIPPAFPWLDATPPAAPTLAGPRSSGGTWQATVSGGTEPVRFWVVRYRQANRWTTTVVDGARGQLSVGRAGGGDVDWVVINAVDRAGNMSPDIAWRIAG